MISLEKNPTEFLKNHAGLAEILKKVDYLAKLNQLWKAHIDPSLATHTRIANIRQNCLVIQVDNNAWAMRLRLLAPQLVKQLSAIDFFSEIKKIEWYVQPDCGK